MIIHFSNNESGIFAATITDIDTGTTEHTVKQFKISIYRVNNNLLTEASFFFDNPPTDVLFDSAVEAESSLRQFIQAKNFSFIQNDKL